MNTKTFPLRVVLTVTTGRLLTEPRGPRDNGISDLYQLLNWITSDNLFTHQLPRAESVAQPYVLGCFPELAAANDYLPKLDEALNADKSNAGHAINEWLAEVKTQCRFADTYDIAPMSEGWTRIDPMIELETMVDPSKIIKVEV